MKNFEWVMPAIQTAKKKLNGWCQPLEWLANNFKRVTPGIWTAKETFGTWFQVLKWPNNRVRSEQVLINGGSSSWWWFFFKRITLAIWMGEDCFRTDDFSRLNGGRFFLNGCQQPFEWREIFWMNDPIWGLFRKLANYSDPAFSRGWQFFHASFLSGSCIKWRK